MAVAISSNVRFLLALVKTVTFCFGIRARKKHKIMSARSIWGLASHAWANRRLASLRLQFFLRGVRPKTLGVFRAVQSLPEFVEQVCDDTLVKEM